LIDKGETEKNSYDKNTKEYGCENFEIRATVLIAKLKINTKENVEDVPK
jgi:hypothetical protein